jgi:hypothetical protein
MGKTQANVRVDEHLWYEVERVARIRGKTADQLIEDALRREVLLPTTDGTAVVQLPTHGRGGLLPGVDLEDKELMDRLLDEP